jgi:hypothetical protein
VVTMPTTVAGPLIPRRSNSVAVAQRPCKRIDQERRP